MSEVGKALEGQVRERAYALWEQVGRPDGRSDEHGHRASREIEEAANPAEPGQPQAVTEKLKSA